MSDSIKAFVTWAGDTSVGEHQVVGIEIDTLLYDFDDIDRSELRRRIVDVYQYTAGGDRPDVVFSDECPDCGATGNHSCPADS
jgi:hypothetical protein